VYKTLEGKETAIDTVKGQAEAKKIIEDYIRAYKRDIEPKVKAERKAKGFH